MTPLIFVVAPYLLVGLGCFHLFRVLPHHTWENMAFAALNLLLVSYAIVAFIGLGHSIVDALAHLKSFLYRPAPSSRRPRFRLLQRSRQVSPGLTDWRSVLDLGTAAATDPGLGPARGWPGPPVHRQPGQLPGYGEFRSVFQPVVEPGYGRGGGLRGAHSFQRRGKPGMVAGRGGGRRQGGGLEGTMVRAALEAARNLPAQGWLALKASVRLLGRRGPGAAFCVGQFRPAPGGRTDGAVHQ